MAIRHEISALAETMTAWRRRLHRHPETAFEEHATSDLVASLLSDWGLKVERGLGGTGVVGSLSVGSSKRAIGLRADMDALNISEHNEFAHRSRHPGKMHACGHDGHTAMLLGAAHYLARTLNFSGTVHFIFQPAEESVSGAKRMIEEGLFRRFPVDAVFGLHNYPLLEEGHIAVGPGPVLACADSFHGTVLGKGGHGAWPHAGIDSVSIAAQIVLGFNQIAARTVDPREPAVISVTRLNGGHENNVIPGEVEFGGTVRAFSPAVRDHIEQSMGRLCEGIAGAYGANVVFHYDRRCPPVINHPKQTELAAQVAAAVVGPARAHLSQPPIMGSEDFAWMLQERPGCYALIGNGLEHQRGAMLHNPEYDFNDRILPIGASYWTELAESALPRN
ncbi:M20 aminoacylase family protein [uncultured Sphingosinicella sp.]|uniref:M20 aminoacylase family protein n=1 Tax=uncultured Sphingosinicella sp. TaxID=478748 RepID=UPI0030DC79A8